MTQTDFSMLAGAGRLAALRLAPAPATARPAARRDTDGAAPATGTGPAQPRRSALQDRPAPEMPAPPAPDRRPAPDTLAPSGRDRPAPARRGAPARTRPATAKGRDADAPGTRAEAQRHDTTASAADTDGAARTEPQTQTQPQATPDPCVRPSIRRATVGWLAVSLGVQVLCALFFVVELVTEVLGLRHWALSWEVREALQVAASLGLVLGAVLGVILLRQTLRRIGEVERQVAAASGAFFEVMDGCFEEWGLTPSEREVALFAVRGYSNGEIAETRGKSEATIKTQMNAVFRKAGVTGRAQLISQFVDVLIASGPAPVAAPAPVAVHSGAPAATARAAAR